MNWLKQKLLRFKAWIVALLIAIGILSMPAVSQIVDFTYTRATTYEGGAPMALADIDETRLYCDGVLVTTEPGADETISADLSIGSHDCYATHVDFEAETPESAPSNIVTRVVRQSRPSAPVLN